jgi:hypothetical protein
MRVAAANDEVELLTRKLWLLVDYHFVTKVGNNFLSQFKT